MNGKEERQVYLAALPCSISSKFAVTNKATTRKVESSPSRGSGATGNLATVHLRSGKGISFLNCKKKTSVCISFYVFFGQHNTATKQKKDEKNPDLLSALGWLIQALVSEGQGTESFLRQQAGPSEVARFPPPQVALEIWKRQH